MSEPTLDEWENGTVYDIDPGNFLDVPGEDEEEETNEG